MERCEWYFDISAGRIYNPRHDYPELYNHIRTGETDLIANEFTSDVTIVTIAPTDRGFRSSRCGIWTNDLSPITTSPGQPFAAGTFVVGTDVAAGTWRGTGGSGCYWERRAGFSGEGKDVIANGFGDVSPVVTIAATDKGFSSSRCGTWTKIG